MKAYIIWADYDLFCCIRVNSIFWRKGSPSFLIAAHSRIASRIVVFLSIPITTVTILVDGQSVLWHWT